MKNKLYILASFLILTLSTQVVSAEEKKPLVSTEQQQARLEEIHQRIVQIQQIDRSVLSQDERKEIRKELREMRKELKTVASGGNGMMAYLIVILGLLLVVIILF